MLKSIEMILGIAMLCSGSVLGIIAGIGQTSSTALCSAISEISGVGVGTVMAILYSAFLLLQFAVLGRDFHASRFLQLIPAMLQGCFLNFFRYKFPPFQTLFPSSYMERLLLFSLALILISCGFAVLKSSSFISFPPESFCYLFAEKHHMRFGTSKILLDILYVASAYLLALAFNLDRGIIREGTVVFALCDGVLINFFTPRFSHLFVSIERYALK